MDETDRGLIEKAVNGDQASFERLIEKYRHKIYGMTRAVCAGMSSEADDVYQETFLTAMKKLSTFKGKSSFSTWLYRIAANNCWMKFRKRKRSREINFDDLNLADMQASLDETTEKELSLSVAKALSKLPVDQRMALTMADIQGLSMEEGAKALDIGVPAFKSRLFRARQALREEFKSDQTMK